jgi:hypothetical protein
MPLAIELFSVHKSWLTGKQAVCPKNRKESDWKNLVKLSLLVQLKKLFGSA